MVRRWNDTVWHTPMGREVHVDAKADPGSYTVVFSDGTKEERVMDMMGRRILRFEVDGVRYVPAPERDWDSGEVTD